MLGVKDEVAWEEFKLFFTNYIAYNSNVIELLLSLATLKSFPMVQTNSSKVDEHGRQSAQGNAEDNTQNTEPSSQQPEWKSTGANLPTLKTRMKKSTVSLVIRPHKTMSTLLRMYPGT